MVLADTLNSVGQIATLIAAGAALVTIWFAKQTVTEAKKARKEAHEAHAEEMGEERKLLDATTAAHEAEMSARYKGLVTEVVMQRLTQLGTITNVLRELTDIARDEQRNPPQRTEINQPLSRIPSRKLQLGVALASYQRLGGPSMKEASAVAELAYNAGTPLMEVLGKATAALSEARSQADAHASLEIPLVSVI